MKPLKCISSLFPMLISAQVLYASIDIAVPGPVGDSSNFAPFGLGVGGSMRYQQVYGSAGFSAVSQGGFITALGFNLSSVQSIGGGLPDIQIDFSTTSMPVDSLSTTFSANVGADDTIVYARGGLLILQNNPAAPPGFGVLINLTTPFFYNPAAGNLLMDVRNYRAGGTSTGPGAFNAANELGDTVSRVYAFAVSDASGIADTFGLNTAFVVTPIPEPGSVILLLAGLSVLAVFIRASTPRRSRPS